MFYFHSEIDIFRHVGFNGIAITDIIPFDPSAMPTCLDNLPNIDVADSRETIRHPSVQLIASL